MPDAYPDRGEIRFRAHRDVGSVLNAMVALIRQNARELLRSYVALVAPVALATGIATALFMFQMGDLMSGAVDPESLDESQMAGFGVTYIGILLFTLLGSALTTAAAAGYVRLYRDGMAGEITAGVLWDESKGLLLPYLGLSLSYGLAFILTGAIAVAVDSIVCLGMVAWFGLAVWSIPYYAVTVATRALDASSLVGAWQRSLVLVKGSWGPTFGALLLSLLLLYVVMIVVSIPFYVVMAFVGVNSVATDPSAMFASMGALFAPLQVVTYAAYFVPLAVLFFVHGRLTEDLEGTSLDDDLDVLAGDAPLDSWIASAPAPSRPAPPASTPPPDLPEADLPDAPDDPPGGFRGGGFRS